MTPLHRELVQLIEAEGPLTIDRFMSICLGHPRFGYYMNRDPFGRGGDFVTAPEVSQMFGELVGVWCAEMWSTLGRPESFAVIELGPGRGTLMADIVRAAGVLPDFLPAAEFHLVETSPLLRGRQRETLSNLDGRVHWHDHILDVPPGPALIVANEFFDALPVRQLEWRTGSWCERAIGLDDNGELSLGLKYEVRDTPSFLDGLQAADGDVVELSPDRANYMAVLVERALAAPLYGLVIDYGHQKSALGDTLQAVREHEYCQIVDTPGESDLTAHVDFQALGAAATMAGACASEVITQRQFLQQLGIETRAARLKEGAEKTLCDDIDQALARLIDCDQMGNLFKVMAVSSPAIPVPYPFTLETS